MDKTLRDHIDSFDGSNEAFAAMIKAAVEFDGLDVKYIEANIVKIAGDMRLSRTAVAHWAKGVNAPVSLVRHLVAKGLYRLYYPNPGQ